MSRYCYICGYETTENDITECPQCLCDDVFVSSKDEEELMTLFDDRELTNAMLELKKNNLVEYKLKLQQLKNAKEQKKQIEQSQKQESSDNKLTCPKCGSSNITEGTKGFSLTTGFIGSENFRYVCKNCGNKWKPGSMLEILQRANNKN